MRGGGDGLVGGRVLHDHHVFAVEHGVLWGGEGGGCVGGGRGGGG